MITLGDVQAARAELAGHVVRTPTVSSRSVSEALGTDVHLKLELFQKTGSFKPRGAFNQLRRVPPEYRARGVVGFSGGNFGQGMAYAASVLGVAAVVFMPEFTPPNYVEATRGYGAGIELVPDLRAAIEGVEHYREKGWAVAHPFDHPAMMAGNGTLGLELVEDVPAVTDVVISIGGGGLISGVATAVKGLKPEVRVWGVETEGADAMSRALEEGRVVHTEPTSLAKTLGAPYVSEATLEITRALVESVTVVSDADAYRSMRFLLERAKVLTELSASCTLAAAESLRHQLGEHVVLVLCGGNVSLDDLCDYRGRFDGESPG